MKGPALLREWCRPLLCYLTKKSKRSEVQFARQASLTVFKIDTQYT